MSSEPRALIKKGLSLWSSDRREAEKAFVEVYWKHENTRDAEIAQAYLYKLRNGDPRPDSTKMNADGDLLEKESRGWFRALYQVMANLYLIVLVLAMLPIIGNLRYLVGGDPSFASITVIVNIGVLLLPAILLFPRVLRRYTNGAVLIPDDFARAKTVGLGVGKFFVWIATIGVFLALASIVLAIAAGQAGIPAGLGIGLSMWPLMIGILTIEVSYRRWVKKN